MPTYDYECQACGYTFEKFQSITAPALRKCPKCGRLKLRRLIGSGAGIIFKGSGFYATDYRSESYKKAARKERDAGGGGKKYSSSAASASTAGASGSAGASGAGGSSGANGSSAGSSGGAREAAS